MGQEWRLIEGRSDAEPYQRRSGLRRLATLWPHGTAVRYAQAVTWDALVVVVSVKFTSELALAVEYTQLSAAGAIAKPCRPRIFQRHLVPRRPRSAAEYIGCVVHWERQPAEYS